jgi:hypothetical protein
MPTNNHFESEKSRATIAVRGLSSLCRCHLNEGNSYSDTLAAAKRESKIAEVLRSRETLKRYYSNTYAHEPETARDLCALTDFVCQDAIDLIRGVVS